MPGDEKNIGRTLCKLFLMLIPALLVSGAFIGSMVFSFWCESIRFPVKDLADTNAFLTDIDDLLLGPWYQLDIVVDQVDVGGNTRIVTRKECVKYELDPDIDSKWKTVRAFTIIAALIGGFSAVAMWFVPCLSGRIPKAIWFFMICVFTAVLPLFQGLTFLLFPSNACDKNSFTNGWAGVDFYEDECEWAGGSTANVIAVGLYFVAGLVMLVTGPPRAPDVPPPETQEVTYQQETAKDGTQTAHETKVVKGTAVKEESNVEEK